MSCLATRHNRRRTIAPCPSSGTQLTQGKGSVEKEGVRIGLRVLKPDTLNPETVKCLAFDAVTARRAFSLDR